MPDERIVHYVIVRAEPATADELSAIAREAKAYWGYPEAWLERWRDLLTITPQFIAANDTFVARADDEIVEFSALLPMETSLRLEHLWILPRHIGRGIGRALFEHAAHYAAEQDVTCLTIEADPHAAPFYEHMGAKRAGSVAIEIDDQPRELPLFVFDLAPFRHSR